MRKCRNGLPVTIDREGQRLPRLRAQRPKRPRRECGVGRRESAKAGDQSLSNGPGTPQNLFCGAFVHFPPAESGQKGRRGALIPRAKCPPEPPVRALRGRFLLHPSPASAAGLRFTPPGDGEQKRRPVCLTKRLRGAILVSVRTAAIAVAVVPNRFLVRRDRRLPLWWAVISYV